MSIETFREPLTPGLYGAQLLVREFAGGLRQARGDVLSCVPDSLAPEVDGFQVAGRLAEIGAPYAEMSDPNLSAADLRDARFRSASLMAYVGIMAKTVFRPDQDTPPADFLEGARRSLTDRGEPQLPWQQDTREAAVYAYGDALHTAIGLERESEWADTIDALFDRLNQTLLEQLGESVEGRRDPARLLHIAMKAGGFCAEMVAIAAAQPKNMHDFDRFRDAARAFGAIGFLQDQATHVTNGTMETYTSALLRQEPDVSNRSISHALDKARAMRKEAEDIKVQEALGAVSPGRERRMMGSQLWFVRNVYPLQRLVGRLRGRNEHIRTALKVM